MPEFKYPQVQRDSKETHEAFGLKVCSFMLAIL